MRKTIVAVLCLALVLCAAASAHPGRTDSSGGHRDNNNVSGLGSYHYHCSGHPAHLHPGGVCPYATTARSEPSCSPEPTSTPKIFQVGSSEGDVRRLQIFLIRYGFLEEGEADGIFGQKTKKAVEAFQAHYALAVTGEISLQEAKAAVSNLSLTSAPHSSPAPMSALERYREWLRENATPSALERYREWQQENRTPTPAPTERSIATPQVLRDGDEGNFVVLVQRKLIELGFLAEGEDDGIFGLKTKAAVEQFQEEYGLPVTGEISFQIILQALATPSPVLSPLPTVLTTEVHASSGSVDWQSWSGVVLYGIGIVCVCVAVERLIAKSNRKSGRNPPIVAPTAERKEAAEKAPAQTNEEEPVPASENPETSMPNFVLVSARPADHKETKSAQQASDGTKIPEEQRFTRWEDVYPKYVGEVEPQDRARAQEYRKYHDAYKEKQRIETQQAEARVWRANRKNYREIIELNRKRANDWIIKELVPSEAYVSVPGSRGKYYHKSDRCGYYYSRENVPLSEALSRGLKLCPKCCHSTRQILKPYPRGIDYVWVSLEIGSASYHYHKKEYCSFSYNLQQIPLTLAIECGYKACKHCFGEESVGQHNATGDKS